MWGVPMSVCVTQSLSVPTRGCMGAAQAWVRAARAWVCTDWVCVCAQGGVGVHSTRLHPHVWVPRRAAPPKTTLFSTKPTHFLPKPTCFPCKPVPPCPQTSLFSPLTNLFFPPYPQTTLSPRSGRPQGTGARHRQHPHAGQPAAGGAQPGPGAAAAAGAARCPRPQR